MKTFVAIYVAASVLVHALLGCCSHHVHSYAGPAGERAVVSHCGHSQAHGKQHSHAHDHGRPHDESSPRLPDHNGGDQCEGQSCIWLKPDLQSVQAVELAATAWLHLPLAAESLPPAPSAARAALRPGGAVLPPLRTHLLCCVLLI
ncbi:MAG: hypothetical protein HYS13_26240 [Planctomycetia bacterium]|nr:hypothetical protein [Planctomycetia bacterium]